MMTEASSNQASTDTIRDVTEVVSSIEEKLCQTNPILSKCSIFRVPDKLRMHNEKDFEPELVSIGPFHHGKEKLLPMQEIKLWYLHCLLSRVPTNETTLKCFVEAIEKIEQECRACYAGEIGFVKKEFIEMMVIDGCFIIEFFRKYFSLVHREEEDSVFNSSWRTCQIKSDLFLLENQLPWRVLECLFSMTRSNDQGMSLSDLILSNLTGLQEPHGNDQNRHLLVGLQDSHGILQIKHLLDCYRNKFVGSFGWVSNLTGLQDPHGNDQNRHLLVGLQDPHGNLQNRHLLVSLPDPEHLLDCYRNKFVGSFGGGANHNKRKCPISETIPSVTELCHAGVIIKIGDKGMLNVTFENGVMTIPPILITEDTKSFFKNMVAFEQCESTQDHKVGSYALLLRDLISTSEDVDILKRKGILKSFLRTEDTLTFINRLGSDAAYGDFLYSNLCPNVQAFCNVRWNLSKAALKRDYFTNTQALVSTYFAIIGLILTILQTTISIRQM
ncbi:UPF0481 protein At3g47200-like isoform X2 [Corylus avellana]|nr:UPF0481 protein At3g47200-like isoform X2 [Corylus avellana]